MTTFLNFNLTQYTQLRQLELQYAKTGDQNEDLKTRMQKVQIMLKQTAHKNIELQQQLQKTQNILKITVNQYDNQVRDVCGYVDKIYRQIQQLSIIGFKVDTFKSQQKTPLKMVQTPRISQMQTIKTQTQSLLNCLLHLSTKNSQDGIKWQKEQQILREQLRIANKTQRQMQEQIEYMSHQIIRLEERGGALISQLAVTRRQNAQFKLRCLETSRQSQSQREDQAIQDNHFALDLLQYQKELLQRIFTRMIKCLQNQAVSQSLGELYDIYKSVTQHYRQKLQIQYDLQDLQREYRRQKTGRVSQQLLIQLRKQIQSFRHQLHKQKQLLSQQQQTLQGCFLHLQTSQRKTLKIASYALDLQKRLTQLHSQSNKSLNTLLPRNKQSKRELNQTQTKRQSEDVSASSRIRFKVTNAEEVMKEAIKRDREVMEKMWKEARQLHISQQ